MVKSSHSCLFVFRGFGGADACGASVLSPGAGDAVGGIDAWLACTALSAWLGKLTMLRPSSSVVCVSDMLGGLVDPMLLTDLDGAAELFICCISYVIFSVFIASRMFVVAVGSRARTVNVQSSWFCSNRRRRLRMIKVSMQPTRLEGMGSEHTSPWLSYRCSCAHEHR
jgi:hypothetical protein